MNKHLLDLSQKYGTPLYVYDASVIETNYNRFASAFKVPKLKVHYACKALPNMAVLKFLHSLGSGLDCVSIGEVKTGLKVGFSGEDIIFTPNGVAYEEFQEAIERGCKITVDNIPMLERIGTRHPNVPLFIRLNPHLMAGGHRNISVGHIDSKFGISIHQLPMVLRLVKKLNIQVEGIHVHTGSDIIDPDVFLRVADLIFSIAEQFETLQSINFGSGFKVQYSPKDLFTNVEAIGKAFTEAFMEFCDRIGKEIVLRFEPGKYLVSNSGFFLTKVTTLKQTTACSFVGIDSGFNHFLRPMFYQAYHTISNLSNPDGESKLYSVVGNICETDTFAEDRQIPEVREGDIILFENAGAYCHSMSSHYNSRPRPAEVMIKGGQDFLIRRRETLEDIWHNQQIPDMENW